MVAAEGSTHTYPSSESPRKFSFFLPTFSFFLLNVYSVDILHTGCEGVSELERKYDGNKCDVKKVRDDDARICENKLKNFLKRGWDGLLIIFMA